MKKTTLRVKVLALLLLWFGAVGTSSALLPGYDVGDLTFNTTAYPGFSTLATNEFGDGSLFFAPVQHLYEFTLTQDMTFNMYAEFRTGDPMMVTIFDSSETQLWQSSGTDFMYTWDGPGNDRDSVDLFPNLALITGSYWLMVEAYPFYSAEPMAAEINGTGSYDLYLKGTPTTVPLPPALLLFGSSLIGFITLGWRRSKA